MKLRPVGPSCSIQMDGQTDMTKLIVYFHNFVNAPKNDTQEKMWSAKCAVC
jgi:hypothetical protein